MDACFQKTRIRKRKSSRLQFVFVWPGVCRLIPHDQEKPPIVWFCSHLFVSLQRKRKNIRIMESRTARSQRTQHPMSYYMEMVKDLDDSQKLELVAMLVESVKPLRTRTWADIPEEETFADMDKELYTAEEAYELTMKDIKAIYDEHDAV